jgi:hypothetical protein
MSATVGLEVEPEARGAERRFAGPLSGSFGVEKLGLQVGPIPAEPLPGFLARLIEDAAERRERHHPAASAAAFARLDDGQRCGHELLGGSSLRA